MPRLEVQVGTPWGRIVPGRQQKLKKGSASLYFEVQVHQEILKEIHKKNTAVEKLKFYISNFYVIGFLPPQLQFINWRLQSFEYTRTLVHTQPNPTKKREIKTKAISNIPHARTWWSVWTPETSLPGHGGIPKAGGQSEFVEWLNPKEFSWMEG